MLSVRKPWPILVLLVAVVTTLTACGPAVTPTAEVIKEQVEVTRIVAGTPEVVVVTPTPEPFKPQGTLIVALSADVNSLEVPYAVEFNAGVTSWSMYDSLLFHTLEGPVAPALAESWELSEDGKTYTFHLRKDVTFHNGEPFTADAVVFSWQTYSQPDVTYASSWTIAESVEKVDDYTVKMTTPDVNPFFLNEMAINWVMIPPKYYAEVGPAGFAEHPVGTGPFMLEEWVKGDHVTVKANPNYWREGYPLVERVIFKPIPESATRLAAIRTGEADIATRLSSEEALSLMGEPGVQIIKTPLDRVQYIGFNNMSTGQGTPIMDRNVRLAINYAIDREAIVASLFDNAAVALSNLFSTNNPGYNPDEVFSYDPEKARQLLAEAGYPNGFETGLACPDGAYLNVNETCEAVVGYLAEIGITTDLQLREANKHWDMEVAKELEPLFFDSWGSSNGEAIQRLRGMLDEGEAYANWYDPELVALIRQTYTTVDPGERAKVYSEIQHKMFEDPPFLYLLQEVSFAAVNTRVSGLVVYPYEFYPVWNISIGAGD